MNLKKRNEVHIVHVRHQNQHIMISGDQVAHLPKRHLAPQRSQVFFPYTKLNLIPIIILKMEVNKVDQRKKTYVK